MLSNIRHILPENSRKSILFCDFRPQCPSNTYKSLKRPVKPSIVARNYLLHSFLNIQICKGFTESAEIYKFLKVRFSKISGHTIFFPLFIYLLIFSFLSFSLLRMPLLYIRRTFRFACLLCRLENKTSADTRCSVKHLNVAFTEFWRCRWFSTYEILSKPFYFTIYYALCTPCHTQATFSQSLMDTSMGKRIR